MAQAPPLQGVCIFAFLPTHLTGARDSLIQRSQILAHSIQETVELLLMRQENKTIRYQSWDVKAELH
jgi:hypothetical protein